MGNFLRYLKTDILGERPEGAARFWTLVLLIASCVLIELVLLLADRGLLGPPRMRALFYEYGGFWPGLLRDWPSNYLAQPYLMFVTYAFLHGGISHLLVNMITLWSLGTGVLDRVGVRGFVLLYLASLLGGAIGFGLLAPDLRPMVGASGALFGLVAGLLSWAYVDRFTEHRQLWPVARAVALLVVLNIVLWWAMNGQLAWETHLGGFVAGWVAALLIDPTAPPLGG